LRRGQVEQGRIPCIAQIHPGTHVGPDESERVNLDLVKLIDVQIAFAVLGADLCELGLRLESGQVVGRTADVADPVLTRVGRESVPVVHDPFERAGVVFADSWRGDLFVPEQLPGNPDPATHLQDMIEIEQRFAAREHDTTSEPVELACVPRRIVNRDKARVLVGRGHHETVPAGGAAAVGDHYLTVTLFVDHQCSPVATGFA